MEEKNRKETIDKLKEINQELKDFLELSEQEQDLILETIREKINYNLDDF